MNQIIKNPVISEKSFMLVSNGKYSFTSGKNMAKAEAKKQIEDVFNVNVVKINSQTIKGKTKISRGHFGKRNDLKKIIFTLKNNQKIDLFDIEKSEKDKASNQKDKKSLIHRNLADDKLKSQINRERKENDPTALSMQGGGK